MLRTYGMACFYWLCRFLYMQSFLSLISLPILIAWGLPFSLYSALGNLVFGPIITLFLLVSCILFFCQLLMIPCMPCVWALEHLTSFWYWSLSYARHEWLMGCAYPSWLVVVLIPIGAVWLVYRLARFSQVSKTAIMCMAWIGVCACLHTITQSSTSVSTIACNTGHVTLLHKNAQLVIVDPGLIGQRQSATSWMQYTLAPHMVRTTGKTVIDHCILLKGNKTVLKAVIALHAKIAIKNLYIPYWVVQKEESLTRTLASLSINVIVLGCDTIIIGDGQNSVGIIKPSKKRTKGDSFAYSSFVFEGRIDNQMVTIYPADYTKRNKDAR